eukprot:CAMPEP_0113943894 /NCGR_PEP_ID=MMETSP1339-20121228/29274_1 /TAXON_ID=94617 /ORGANISM="Fibrocapsa japonica" /LENGTH=113 /DNA_ID=CAMNT_0000948885 /DNA_START=29 /DNA_END=367 /DNA_ORIENTATION=+ /assembly_acc=CAM_ASM_000762
MALSASKNKNEVPYRKGQQVEINDVCAENVFGESWRIGQIEDVDPVKRRVLVSYYEFSNFKDEWIQFDSSRLDRMGENVYVGGVPKVGHCLELEVNTKWAVAYVVQASADFQW